MELTNGLMDALFVEKVLAARERPFEEKFLAGGILFEASIERMRIGILMDQPHATEEHMLKEVERRLAISRQLGGENVSPNDIVLKVALALERAHIPFMIVGGFSNNVYGIERNTQDADFVVELQVEGWGGLMAELGPDFKLDPQLAFGSLVAMGQYYVVRHLNPLFKIELFLAKDDAANREQFQRRRKVRFHGQTLYFIGPEDLIVTKLKWFSNDRRRTKDFEDVRGVLAVQKGKLDMELIRKGCGVHGTSGLLEDALRSLPTMPDNRG